MIIKNELKNYIWPLKDEEKIELEKSILKEGCRDALIYAEIDGEEVLLDGHNRLEICEKHGIEYKTILNKDVHTIEQAKDWIDSNQIARRNLTMDQFKISIGRRYLAEKKTPETQTRSNQYIVQGGQNAHPAKTEERLSEEYSVDPKTIRRYAQQARQYEQLEKEAPEMAEKIRNGENINKVITEIKRKEIIAKLNDIKEQEVKKINGVYDVIVIDPPWEMKKIEMDVAPNQVEFDYPTMTVEEIKKISLPCAQNCHVWLWTTQKYLPIAFEILKEWGLKYVCTFVWHKNGGFQPFKLPQYNCEFVLYAHKGSPIFIDFKDFKTCFNAPRNGHSVKPDVFYDIVRRTTAGRRLDMFNRRKIDGFETWGNEAK